jgi:hypothetical protein
MQSKLAVFLGAMLVGGAIAYSTDAAAWQWYQHGSACFNVNSAQFLEHGLGSNSSNYTVACPGFRFRSDVAGINIKRQNTTTVEVSLNIPSGWQQNFLNIKACLADINGTSGACSSSATGLPSPFTGWAALNATNISFWQSGTIGGVFDQWDSPYILVFGGAIQGSNITSRVVSYGISGTD